MAIGIGGGTSRRRSRGPVTETERTVERRVFVHASPRTVWSTLHDPAATTAGTAARMACSGLAITPNVDMCWTSTVTRSIFSLAMLKLPSSPCCHWPTRVRRSAIFAARSR